MPEIKNSFLQGKMNKDLDERLIPNGQYRDALNIEVATSQGSDVGTVQNILGNKRVEDIVPSGFKCVGSIADEKNNKLYWFVTTYEKDAIIEYDARNEVTTPVIVDTNAGNFKSVLKFSGNMITGINIIDNLLFWTDNNSDPKKINIDECKRGTADFDTHTQLVFDDGSFNGITIEKVVRADYFDNNGNYTGDDNDNYEDDYGNIDDYMLNRNTTEKFFIFQRRQLAKLLGIDFKDFVDDYGNIINANQHASDTSQQSGTFVTNIRHYRKGRFLGVREIQVFDDDYGLRARLTNSPFNKFKVGDVIFGNNII